MSRDLTLAFDLNAYLFSCAKNVSALDANPRMDFRRAQPGAHLPSLLRLERESPLHEVVERAVASGGGKVESVWWLFEDGARKVTTSVRGEDLQWCRAGDVVRLAQDTPPEDGELLVWSKAVLAMLAVLPPDLVVYVWWS